MPQRCLLLLLLCPTPTQKARNLMNILGTMLPAGGYSSARALKWFALASRRAGELGVSGSQGGRMEGSWGGSLLSRPS